MGFLIGILKTVGQWLIPYVVQEVVTDYFKKKKAKEEADQEPKKDSQEG